MPDAELASKIDRVSFVRFWYGSRICSDRHGPLAESPRSSPGQICRIRAAGIGHDHLAHLPQDREQSLLFLFHNLILLQWEIALSVRSAVAILGFGNDAGCRDAVTFFQAHQPHALGGAPGLANLA